MATNTPTKKSSNLLAIFLITRSRPGPKLVFHYPPNPAVPADDDDSDSEQDDDQAAGNRGRGASDSTVRHVLSGRPDVDLEDPLERVLGHGTETLERFLTPGRWSDGKKFEVCLDGVTFVGLPVYGGEDGTWGKKAKDGEGKVAPMPALSKEASFEELEGGVAGVKIPAPQSRDFTHAPDSLDSKAAASFGTSVGSASTASGVVAEQMTMFHVVFALSAGALEPDQVFGRLARPLSKAMKYCQKQTNYVAAESRKMLALKTKAKVEKMSGMTLWTQMPEYSELAWALKEIYTQISVGEIASVRLDGNELSLQVPQTHTSSEVSLQSAILLLEDKDTLLHNVPNNDPPTQALAYFIREHTPTKSLAKHATNLSLPPKTVLHLARHLVHWRKARPIAPLHPRNTYIIQTEAPPLHQLSDDYARRFPALPSLEAMLRMLGGRPVKYGLLIQSRDHRAAYMEILAWLVRWGLVVQLRAFGWLRRRPREGDEDEERWKPTSVVGLLGARLRSRSRDGDGEDSDRASEDTAVPFHASEHPEIDSEGADTGLITDPLHPSPREKAVLKRMSTSLDDVEFEARFPSLLKYFDGEHAFEEIAGEEGLKRAKVEEWIGGLEKRGWLRVVRYS